MVFQDYGDGLQFQQPKRLRGLKLLNKVLFGLSVFRFQQPKRLRGLKHCLSKATICCDWFQQPKRLRGLKRFYEDDKLDEYFSFNSLNGYEV